MVLQKEKELVPKLRFKEFHDNWNEKRLEQLFSEFKSGKGITSSKINENGLYPVYGGNGLRGYSQNFTHEGKYFLIGRQGALCGNINRSNGKVFISEHAIACRANESSDTEWLAQRLDYYNLNRLSESSAQPGLSVNKLLRFKLIIPLLPEQQKIATFLSVVDKKIEQLIQKKTLLETYKKGVMQKIFSQEIRFKEVDESNYSDWKERKLGDICEISKGKQLNKSELKELGKYPAINGGINPSGYTNRWNTKKNTTTISEGGNSCGFVNFIKVNFWSGGHCYSLLHPLMSINKYYLFQVVKFNEKYIMKLRVGSGLPNIQKKEINNFRVFIPSLNEQQKIADLLRSIDIKIELVNTQLEQTKVFKKGLLQQMFV